MHVTRDSLVDRAAASLRSEIAADRWQERLPGQRVLAKLLGVSVPTISQALRILAEEGWVHSSGDRRRFRVPTPADRPDLGQGPAVNPSTTPPGPASRAGQRLLVLTEVPLSHLVYSTLHVLNHLQTLANRDGWEVIYHSMPYIARGHANNPFDKALAHSMASRVIAVQGSPGLAAWAAHREAPIAFLGGTKVSDYPVYTVAVSITEALQRALELLIHRGCRTPVLPLCGRSRAFNQRIRQAFSRTCHAAGLDFDPALNTPAVADGSGDGVRASLTPVLRQRTIDSLLFLDHREFIAISRMLHEHGYQIPENLSLVGLSHEYSMEYNDPPISHFRYPVERMAAALHLWLRGQADHRTDSEFFEPVMVTTGSVRAAAEA